MSLGVGGPASLNRDKLSPQRRVTAQDIDAWLQAARERQAPLHRQAALTPWDSDQRQEVLTVMAALLQERHTLLQEACEEVRVISAATRVWSQGVRSTFADL